VWEQVDLIETDFQHLYHLDLSTPGLLDTRTARWMKVRVLGLLRIDSQLRHAMDRVNARKAREAAREGLPGGA
jgi:hypothetical protein